MGTIERKNRQKAEIRDQILKAAMQLYTEEGIEKTSIRNIANAIEYSPGTVYLYFKNKAEIMHALHTQGFSMLRQRFEALFSVSDPMERLKAMGRVYLQFSVEEPGLYDLMFSSRYPIDFLEGVDEVQWTQGQGAFDALRSTVAACMEQGRFSGHDPELTSFLVWSTVHGMAALRSTKRIQKALDKPSEGIVERAHEEFLLMLDKI